MSSPPQLRCCPTSPGRPGSPGSRCRPEDPSRRRDRCQPDQPSHQTRRGTPRFDYHIFGTATGTVALDHRQISTAFRLAVTRADFHGTGRLSPHSLRHGYASTLISQGLNVVFVSRQLGHANPNITLGVYAHLFQHADHVTAARQALDTSYRTLNPRPLADTRTKPGTGPTTGPTPPAPDGNDSGNNHPTPDQR
ncbi:tyrosine-type recombinase/integrase [Nocardioides panacis]|uniref:Tyrosine-type recombinase/integrase n=1 Tax=Nocardioides panacis TaxID=2849501 RepID=A0A975SXB5_9ACTN|nr:tyrosine-type recombinase/integrase [Nocardioides panacis]